VRPVTITDSEVRIRGVVEFRILGPLEVLDGGRPVKLRAAKQRALLGVLLLHANEVVSTERLIDALWGERRPTSAQKLVQGYVSALRKMLAPDMLVTREPGYLLGVAGSAALDSLEFQHRVREARAFPPEEASSGLREALALWHGPVLAGLSLEGMARHEAARLDELRLDALLERIDADLACGRHGELVGELEALVAEHPLRERLRAQLMLALYRSGRQTDALRRYRETRELLVEQLGIEPGAELQALERAILNQDSSLSVRQRADGPAPTNVPTPATPLIGRERELAVASELLRSHRLLTLIGAGGCGKSRLAMALAAEATAEYPDGVWWVPLQALTDPELVLPTIAHALGARNGLADHLKARTLLIVLDNFEQVVPASTAVGELLTAAPGVRVLVTSRERLQLSGEQLYPVPVLGEAQAVELFTERAREVSPDFTPVAAVTEICRRLDCLPLAIELAAARVRVLDPEAMLQRLGQTLALLTGGPRDAPSRHRTLRAALDWGYDLLAPRERRLFAHLAVFAGGCTLASAEAVCEAELDTLASLVDKSLLRCEGERYSMLATIREYAQELLRVSGEANEVNRRHAEHFLALAEEVRPTQRVDPLEAERENFRAALAWSRDTGEPALELALAAELETLWLTRGPLSEARMWLEDALGRTSEATLTRARAMILLATVASAAGDMVRHKELAEESLALARALGDRGAIGWALTLLAAVAEAEGDWETAACYADETAAVVREEGSSRLASSVYHEGWAALARGDHVRARAKYEESYAVGKQLGDESSIWYGLVALGQLALLDGQAPEGAERLRDGLRLAHRFAWTSGAIICLASLATVAATAGDHVGAARLLGAAEALQEEIGARLLDSLPERKLREQAMAAVRIGLQPAQLAAAWAEGRALSLDEAVDYALAID
jgi:predicted ATPase/DNA-binding SARP family transcriptional activator